MKPLTVAQACEFLKCKKSTLYDLMKRGRIPFGRRPYSRVILFDQHELEAWLRTGWTTGTTARPQADEDAVPVPVDMSPTPVYHRRACYR